MIWYKAWLETRFGVAFLFVLFSFVFLVAGAGVRLGTGVVPSNKHPSQKSCWSRWMLFPSPG